jgi:hypothetical protein
LLVAVLDGCATAVDLHSLPLTAGIEARYAVPADTIVAALPPVLATRGLTHTERSAPDSATTMLLAASTPRGFSSGTAVRVVVRHRPGPPHSVVRIAAASPKRHRSALRLVQSVDSALGPEALGPFAGDIIRGRGTASSDGRVEGLVVEGPDSSLLVARQDRTSVPLSRFSKLVVYRGRYDHRGAGVLAGLVLGLAASWIVINNMPPAEDVGQGVATACGIILLGPVVGGVTGLFVGQSIQTSEWSDVR